MSYVQHLNNFNKKLNVVPYLRSAHLIHTAFPAANIRKRQRIISKQLTYLV